MPLKEFLKDRSTRKGFKEEKDPDIIGLDFDIMKQDHEQGVQIADPCMIDQMSKNFAWMRGDQNCWTGFPNEGKTQIALFMKVVKSLKSGWKWAIWSPEMKGANFVDGKVKTHYNYLAYDIMASLSGKTPYKHIHERYNGKIPLLSIDEKYELKKWIEDHFIFLDPKKKKIGDIEILLKRVYENVGYDGVFIDPFKNIEVEVGKRDDQHLNDVFARMKETALERNISMNWIAHPKSGVSRVVVKKGVEMLIPCNQYHLAGGAAWDNGMDGIYSIHRPNALEDIKSPVASFHNLKQKKQDLVAERGTVTGIEFDIKTRRYIFDGYSPLGFAETMEEKSTKYDSGDVFKDQSSDFNNSSDSPF